MESNISSYPLKHDNVEMSLQEHSQVGVGSSLEADNFKDQILYDPDGQAFNLSSVSWSYVSYFYDYQTGDNNNNNNNNTSHHEPVPPERAITVAAFVIFIVGFIANALVIYTFARYRATRRGANLYFLNISMADILYMVVCLPTLCETYDLVHWRFGNSLCKLVNYVMSVTVSVSALTILSCGLHQYLTITNPGKCRPCRTNKSSVCVLCLVWILSFAIMTPKIFIFNEMPAYHHKGRVTVCARDATVTNRQIDAGLMFICLYLLPLLVLLICCCMIGRALWLHRFHTFAPNSPVQKTVVRCRGRNAKIVFVITAVFALRWLPLHVFQLVEDFDYGKILFGEYIDRGNVAVLVSLVTKVVNPIVYCLFNRNLKTHGKESITCKNCRTCLANQPVSMTSKSLVKTEGAWAPRNLLSLPVTLLSDMLPSRHGRLPPNGGSVLARCPSLRHLQPLLEKHSGLCACKSGSAFNSRSDSVTGTSLIKGLDSSCTSFMEKGHN